MNANTRSTSAKEETEIFLSKLFCYQNSSLKKSLHSLIHELTFVANIQVYFADFPYLHYSITPEALNLGDLLRFRVRVIIKKVVLIAEYVGIVSFYLIWFMSSKLLKLIRSKN